MSRRYRVSQVMVILACAGLLAAQTGCGRGGGGGNGGGGGGNNGNGTPTPTSVVVPPTQAIVVGGGGNISDIAKGYPDGVQITVGSGSYPPIQFERGDFRGPVTLIADDSEGPVTINGRGHAAAIDVEGIDLFEVDGFQIIGGTEAVVKAVDSVDVILQNNTMMLSDGDGVHLETCAGVLVFDNLIIENGGAGVAALGQNTIEIINNTFYSNNGGGIVVRRLAVPGDSIPSAFAFLQNNIIDNNNGFGILVDPSSTTGFQSLNNLNNDGYSGVQPGSRDLTADPMFISPPRRNFRLQVATGSGGSPAFDRGDPATDPFFIATLETRTTRVDSFLDNAPPDLGYHYPNGIFSPTPVPTWTPTGVVVPPPQPTNTRPAQVTSTRPTSGPTATPTPTSPAGTINPTSTPTATATPIQFTPTRTRPVGG